MHTCNGENTDNQHVPGPVFPIAIRFSHDYLGSILPEKPGSDFHMKNDPRFFRNDF